MKAVSTCAANDEDEDGDEDAAAEGDLSGLYALAPERMHGSIGDSAQQTHRTNDIILDYSGSMMMRWTLATD